MLFELEFAYPFMLYLLAVPALMVLWYVLSFKKHGAEIKYVHSEYARGTSPGIRGGLYCGSQGSFFWCW